MKLKDFSLSVTDLLRIDPRKLVVDPGYNVRRFDSANDELDAELKSQIKARGVEQPLTIRLKDEQPMIVAGHRRHAAVLELIEEGVSIDTVPCIPERRYMTDAERVVHLVTSNSGKPLTTLEKGEVFKRLLGLGWDDLKIANEVGYSTKQVQNILTLAGASVEVQEMVSSGQVSATEAIKTVKREGDNAGAVLAEARQVAVASGKDRVTAKAVKQVQAPKAAPAAPAASTGANVLLAAFGVNPLDNVLPLVPSSQEKKLKIAMSPERFEMFLETLQGILEETDVGLIHEMVKDTLTWDPNSMKRVQL